MIILGIAHQGFSQCRIINNKHDSVFITFERTGSVKVQGEEERQPGVILRLKNNSNCAVTIDAEVNGDFVVRRNTVIPDVLYTYRAGDESNESMSGDAFAVINIRGGRSILFGVPIDHFDEPGGLIEVPFRYKWEDSGDKDGSAVTVDHKVFFSITEIPKGVISSKDTEPTRSYPALWFAPINDQNKPAWDILPLERQAGKVILSKRNELGILSNFAATPFELYGKGYASDASQGRTNHQSKAHSQSHP